MVKWLVAVLVIWVVWKLLARPKRPAPRPFSVIADEAEARAVLGVPTNADDDAIRAAHRRLVGQVHPDRGGSPELARRVNAARDLLLRAPR